MFVFPCGWHYMSGYRGHIAFWWGQGSLTTSFIITIIPIFVLWCTCTLWLFIEDYHLGTVYSQRIEILRGFFLANHWWLPCRCGVKNPPIPPHRFFVADYNWFSQIDPFNLSWYSFQYLSLWLASSIIEWENF